ncbi:hypothetical protein, partial [Novosphingobium sp.]|uniref:hypothetical protein n=1 Tax=Novosphingobium sp. TaxID=1874826 RepID=UPI0038B73066
MIPFALGLFVGYSHDRNGEGWPGAGVILCRAAGIRVRPAAPGKQAGTKVYWFLWVLTEGGGVADATSATVSATKVLIPTAVAAAA